MEKNKLALIIGILIIIVLATASFTYVLTMANIKSMNAEIPLNFTVGSIHMTTSFYKDGVLLSREYHAGAVTNFGLNQTLAKLIGNNSFYSLTYYVMNLTYVGIGNQGTLNSASTILPGEWNRTSGTQHDLVYNSFNITAIIYPDAGPYTADCMGIYFNSTGNCLWGYDTRSEVTGIDDTFTITVEIQVSAS